MLQKQQEQRSIEAYPSTSMSMLQHADRRMLNEMDKFRTVIMTVQLERTNSNRDHDLKQLPKKPCWTYLQDSSSESGGSQECRQNKMPSIRSKMNDGCCQPDQKLNRTTLYGALYIIYEYRANPQHMVFLLIALVYGFTPRRLYLHH